MNRKHKRETALAACLPIKGQAALTQLSVLTEQMLEIFHFCVEGKISYVNRHETKKLMYQPFDSPAESCQLARERSMDLSTLTHRWTAG